MEQNGRMSFLGNTESGSAALNANLIVDGKILKHNLEKIGKSDWWLIREIDKRKMKVGEIMLATIDAGELVIYPFSQKKEKNNIFE